MKKIISFLLLFLLFTSDFTFADKISLNSEIKEKIESISEKLFIKVDKIYKSPDNKIKFYNKLNDRLTNGGKHSEIEIIIKKYASELILNKIFNLYILRRTTAASVDEETKKILEKYVKFYRGHIFQIENRENCYYTYHPSQIDLITELMFSINTNIYTPKYLYELDKKIVEDLNSNFYTKMICHLNNNIDLIIGTDGLYSQKGYLFIIIENEKKTYEGYNYKTKKGIKLFNNTVTGGEVDPCIVKTENKYITLFCDGGVHNGTKQYFDFEGNYIKTIITEATIPINY